jgi:hypothetical protein
VAALIIGEMLLRFILKAHQLEKLRDWLEQYGCAFDLVHTGGHIIFYQNIMHFIERATPGQLISIHTTAAEKMAKQFTQFVIQPQDGEPYFL